MSTLHSYKPFVTDLLSVDTQQTSRIALCIVNPNSGAKKGPKALAIIKPIFEQANIQVKVFETTHAGHCGEICEKEDLTNIDILCPIGGDGTVHECCNGLMNRQDDAAKKVIVCIIPAGSGNTVAFDMLIINATIAAKAAVAGKYRNLDLARIEALDDNGKILEGSRPLYSMNIAGWALPSKVMKTANAFRFCGCGAWYNFAINLFILTNDNYKVKVTYKGADGQEQEREGKLAMLSCQNSVHIGDKLPLAPDAKLDDGLLDLAFLYNRGVLTNIKTFDLAKKGKHVDRSQIFLTKCTECTIMPLDGRLKGPNTVNVDGELNGPTPCKITVVPGALRFFCPSS
jgi:diacylglycerol kinase (ATP)